MDILIVGDAFIKLHPETDTSLFLAKRAYEKNHALFWTTIDQLSLISGRIFTQCTPLTFSTASFPPSPEKEAPPQEEREILDFSMIWIRKDPPFDLKYLQLCWFLSLEQSRITMINRPDLLLLHHEKMLPFEAFRKGFLSEADLIPTWIPQTPLPNKAPLSLTKKFISKPFLGYAGKQVELWESYESWKASFLSTLNASSPSQGSTSSQSTSPPPPLAFSSCPPLVQPFLDEVQTRGDRRVFFLEGEMVGDFLRLPKQGEMISNLAQGGLALAQPITEKEKKLCQKIGAFLKSINIFFAGADLLCGKLSEINITSPTGLVQLKSLKNIDIRDLFLEKMLHL